MADFVSRLRLVVDSSGTDRSTRKMRQLRSETERAKRAATQLRAAYAALGAVLGGIVSANLLRGFNEQARSMAKVEQAIRSTAGAAGFASKELEKVAGGLQRITLFGDEEILNGVTAQLLTFTNIANDEFKRTQVVALDLATVLDQDLKSASIQLGKALNDPVKNLSALSRSGIQFSKTQEDLIKTLAQTGELAEAQRVILAELERQYGGQAEAAARVGTGALTQLQNVVSDIGELLGERFFNTIAPGVNALRDFLAIDANQAAIVDVISNLGVALAAIAIPSALALLPALFAALVSPIALTVAAIAGLVAFRDEIANFLFGVADAGAVVQATFEVLGPTFSRLGTQAIEFAKTSFEAIQSFAMTSIAVFNDFRERTASLIPPQALEGIKLFGDNVIGIFVTVARTISELFVDALLLPLRGVERLYQAISGIEILPDRVQQQLRSASQELRGFAQAIDDAAGGETFDNIVGGAQSTINAIGGAVSGAVDTYEQIQKRALDIAEAREETEAIEGKINRQLNAQKGAVKDIADEAQKAREAVQQQQKDLQFLIEAARQSERQERIAREVLDLRRQIKGITDDEAFSLAEQNVALEEQLDLIREQRALLEAPFDELANNLEDAIVNGGLNGVDGLKDIFNSFLDSLKDAFLLSLFQPLLDSVRNLASGIAVPLFGGASGGVQSRSLAGQAANDNFAASGGILGLGGFNLGSLAPLLALAGGSLSGNNIAGLTFGALSAIGGGALVSQLGRLGLFGSTFGGADKFIANQLAGAGSFANIGGGLLGSIGSSLLFGNSTGTNIGSTIGGIAGNLIPIPFVGPLIGSTIGGAIGSLFGNRTSVRDFDLATGAQTFVQNSSRDSRNQRTQEIGAAAVPAIQALIQALGGTVAPGVGLNVFARGGEAGVSLVDTETRAVLTDIIRSSGDDIGLIVGDAVRLVLDNAVQGVADENIQLAKDLIDSGLGIDAVIESLQVIEDFTSRFNVDEPLGRFEQSIEDINDAFELAITSANGIAAAEERLIETRDRAIAQVIGDFNDEVQADIDRLLDGPLDRLEQLLELQERRASEAEAIGADLELVSRLSALELREFFESLNDEALREVESFLGLFREASNAVSEQLDFSRQDLENRVRTFEQLATSFASQRTDFTERFIAQSPRESLDILRGRASELFSDLQRGNEAAGPELQQVLNDLVTNARATFGNTAGFANVLDFALGLLDQAELTALDLATEAERQLQALDAQTDILADIREILQTTEAYNALFRSFNAGGVASSDELLALITSGAGLTAAANDNAAALNVSGLIAQSVAPVVGPLATSIDQFTQRLSDLPSLMLIQIEKQEETTGAVNDQTEKLSDILERIETLHKEEVQATEELANTGTG